MATAQKEKRRRHAVGSWLVAIGVLGLSAGSRWIGPLLGALGVDPVRRIETLLSLAQGSMMLLGFAQTLFSVLRARLGDGERGAARRVFGLLELFLPERLCREDLGDALEVMARMVEEGRPRWQVYGKIATTVFWACVNGLREWASALGRKRPNR
jgi:hypothetical protein